MIVMLVIAFIVNAFSWNNASFQPDIDNSKNEPNDSIENDSNNDIGVGDNTDGENTDDGNIDNGDNTDQGNTDIGEDTEQGTCFVSGTLVLMDDGTKKPIESVVVGDKVLTYNEKTQAFESGCVVNAFVHTQTTDMARLKFADGTVIEMSACHPIGTVSGYKSLTGYQDLPLLQVGDFVITANGDSIEIVSIERWIESTPVVVYNLDVEDNDNYFVGDTPILVHNKGDK